MQTLQYVSCFVLRPAGAGFEALQLLRSPSRYMGGTWQFVTGAIEPGETAVAAVRRELREETGFSSERWYQLDLINTFFVAKMDAIVQCVQFVTFVSAGLPVALNDEHDGSRWEPIGTLHQKVLWPGERVAIDEVKAILADDPIAEFLRLEPA